MRRPVAALMMRPELEADLFDEVVTERLHGAARLVGEAPVTSWEAARHAGWLGSVEVLITGWGAPRLDEHVLSTAPSLRAVVHAAGSVKELLAPAVWDRGVLVATAADANSIPVAEFTLGAVLMSLKRAWLGAARLRGDAEGPTPTAARGPEVVGGYGRTVGVVGASRIGRRVIRLLRHMELEILVSDPFADAADVRSLGGKLVKLDDLIAASDVVTLHAPALPQTRRMMDAQRLAIMKDGATLINTARGALVDHDALTRELVSGRLSAVLDVSEPEPLPFGHPLLSHPHAFVTPHIAGALGTELRRLGSWAVDEIERYARGEPFAAPVTATDLDRIA